MSYRPHYPKIKIGRQDGEGDPPDEQVPDEPAIVPPVLPILPTTAKPEATKEVETFYLPIIILTAIFGAIFIIGPIAVRKGPNVGIVRCSIMITAFCMWIFWVTVYISQMNPLLGPRLHNTSAAWIGYAWGKNAKTLSEAGKGSSGGGK